MNITEEEKIELRNRAKVEMERLEKILSDKETAELLDRYKNRFNLCESVYKVVLREHQIKTKGKAPTYLKINMTQAPYAMAFAGYDIDRELLNRLFGAKCVEGQTAKKLRDAVTHGLNQRAIDEIKARECELFNDMNSFLEMIKAA